MALPSKRPNLDQGDRHNAYTILKTAFKEVDKVDRFPGFNQNEVQCILSMKYGFSTVTSLIDALTKIQFFEPSSMRLDIFKELVNVEENIAKDVFQHMGNVIPVSSDVSQHIVFAPPTTTCHKCGKPVSVHNRIIGVKFYGLTGMEHRKKVSTRCSDKRCATNYHITTFGKKNNFVMYSTKSNVIEITDSVIVDRQLFEMYCNSHLHCWTTFEGFAESYNATHNVAPENSLTRKHVSKMYFLGEVVEELYDIGWANKPLVDTDLDEIMDEIEENRQTSLYKHDCSPICESKGCGKLYVIDGLWKLVHTVCAMRTENVVNGMPLLKYPDVCTNQPVAGHAFCEEHKSEMEKVCPTKLRDFLQFKGVTPKEAKQFDDAMSQHPQLSKVGTPIIATQGAVNMVKENTKEVVTILNGCDTLPTKEEPCNKETGERASLHMKSRGYVFIVTAGGYIQSFSPIYRSESPSQVYLIILCFLYLLFQDIPEEEFGKFWLAYDNMCNVMRLKVANMKSLPLPGKFANMWEKIHKMVDGLHITNHKRDMCKTILHPKRFDEAYPEIAVNSMAAEQTFAWTGRYKKQICSLPKRQQMFMLHRLCKRRNNYTKKCHVIDKRNPLLPGRKNTILK